MKAKNLVLLCALSLIISYCGPQQPQKTTSGGILFPTSTTPTSTSSSTPPATTSTTTTPPATTTTTTTPQPISSGFIIDKTGTGVMVGVSDPCIQIPTPTSIEDFNLIFDVRSSSTSFSKSFNLGLDVFVCNSGGPLAGTININQFLYLSKRKNAVNDYWPLEMSLASGQINLDQYGFVGNNLALNWNLTTGRKNQAMGVMVATEERYQFRCDSSEKFMMEREEFLLPGPFYSLQPGLPSSTISMYKVIIVLRRTPDGAFLGAMKWEKYNLYADLFDIKIPCSVFQ